MKPFVFERRQILPIAVDQAWEFFSEPSSLARITPPSMDFRLTSPAHTEFYAGMILTYSLRPLFGVSVAWTTEITHLHKPFYFVDEQRFGPYRFWHHQHRFTEVADGVEMHDLVHYLLPHMQFTRLAHRWIIAPRLKRIFDYRQKTLNELFPVRATE